METQETTKPVFVRILLGSITAGAVGVVANNLYNLLYSNITGSGAPEIINFGSVTSGSLMPAVAAGLVYYLLSRFTHRATRVFIIISVVLLILSLFKLANMTELSTGVPVPDGFTGLTIPMHIISGLAIVLIVPRFVKNKN